MAQIKINWMDHCGNLPEIEIIDFEYVIDWEALRYTKRGTLHRADQGPIVRYFCTDGQPCSGFGGREITGTFIDGSKFEYIGAWSSRAGVINLFWPEDKVVDVSIGLYATAVRAEWLIALWREQRPDFGLAWVRCGQEITLEPTRGGKLKDDRMYQIIEHIER